MEDGFQTQDLGFQIQSPSHPPNLSLFVLIHMGADGTARKYSIANDCEALDKKRMNKIIHFNYGYLNVMTVLSWGLLWIAQWVKFHWTQIDYYLLISMNKFNKGRVPDWE